MEYRVTDEQLHFFLDYIGNHTILVRGVGLGARAKEKIFRIWEHLAHKLNSMDGGASKSAVRWKKYWADIKHKARSRAASRGNIKLVSEVDQQVLKIIKHSVNPAHKTPQDVSEVSKSPTQCRLSEEKASSPYIMNTRVEENLMTPEFEFVSSQSPKQEFEFVSSQSSKPDYLIEKEKNPEDPTALKGTDANSDSESDNTSILFSKIIARELSDMPKNKRLTCMQELLGVLKKYSS